MKFIDFSFSGMPRKISVKYGACTARAVSYEHGELLQNTGSRAAVIEGEYVFTGRSALNNFRRLSSLAGRSGVLIMDGLAPVNAILTYAQLISTEDSGRIICRFTFEEDRVNNKPAPRKRPRALITACEGDSLWKISDSYGIDMNTLRAANPHIVWASWLSSGERVVIP